MASRKRKLAEHTAESIRGRKAGDITKMRTTDAGVIYMELRQHAILKRDQVLDWAIEGSGTVCIW